MIVLQSEVPRLNGAMIKRNRGLFGPVAVGVMLEGSADVFPTESTI